MQAPRRCSLPFVRSEHAVSSARGAGFGAPEGKFWDPRPPPSKMTPKQEPPNGGLEPEAPGVRRGGGGVACGVVRGVVWRQCGVWLACGRVVVGGRNLVRLRDLVGAPSQGPKTGLFFSPPWPCWAPGGTSHQVGWSGRAGLCCPWHAGQCVGALFLRGVPSEISGQSKN